MGEQFPSVIVRGAAWRFARNAKPPHMVIPNYSAAPCRIGNIVDRGGVRTYRNLWMVPTCIGVC